MKKKLQDLSVMMLLLTTSCVLLTCATGKRGPKTSAQVDSTYQDHYQVVQAGPKLASLGLSIGKSIELNEFGIDATVTKLSDSSYFIRERRLVINEKTGRSVPLISIVKVKKSDLSSNKNDNSIKAGKKADLSEGKTEVKKIITKDKEKVNSGNKVKFQFPWWIIIVIIVGYLGYRYRKVLFSFV